MKPPCFYLFVSLHTLVHWKLLCKYHCRARSDQALSAGQVLISCCCLQWKCSLQWHLQQKCSQLLLIALVTWKTSEKWVLYSMAALLSDRCIFKADEGWDTFAAPWKILISIGRKQQGSAAQHCLGLRVKFLFLSLGFVALHSQIPCQWMVPFLGVLQSGVAGQGAAGNSYFKQTVLAVYLYFPPEKPILEKSYGVRWYLGSVYIYINCCCNKNKAIPCRT